ncbi:MAG: hypothetical protein JO358_06190 [Alphaproteobacteria bacterium]|nr:hypothetical protein [Alphaproteobacteria bacterium]
MRAQSAEVPRIGWIWARPSAGDSTEAAGFRQGLKELGYIDGQNIIVDHRFGADRNDHVADQVTELVQLWPDVLGELGDGPVRAVKRLTTTIPAAVMSGDPVCAGFVASLVRPLGNNTGVSMMRVWKGGRQARRTAQGCFAGSDPDSR